MNSSTEGPVLVIGAAGCIGAQVVANLVRDGATPVVFDIAEDRRRLHLVMEGKAADGVAWVAGSVLNAMDRPQDLRQTVQIDDVARLAVLVMGREAAVIGRMPVLRRDDEIESLLHAIGDRDDLVTARHRESAARNKVILKIDEYERSHETTAH